MAERRPLISVGGSVQELPAGDALPKLAIPLGGRFFVGDTPPADAIPGDGWLCSLDCAFAVLYDDGNSQQWVVVSGGAGPRGASVELQRGATHIQWRLAGDATWLNLVALADLKGDPGDGADVASATLTIIGGSTNTQSATGGVVLQPFLQRLRDNISWLLGRFDGDGKALEAVSAGTATNATNAENATSAGNATKWAGANKTVSTSAPSGGSDGDIWFQREA